MLDTLRKSTLKLERELDEEGALVGGGKKLYDNWDRVISDDECVYYLGSIES